jgi:dihydrofolate synthase/folylpolyglutamate synthase
MNYQQTLDWLFTQLPMFQRQGASAYKADLSNTLRLMELLGHPEIRFKSIHIAGTNGKGSVSHSLAAAFQRAGYKTGLYTSPHLVDFRERIRINGEMISKNAVQHFVAEHQAQFTEIGLSFFEMTVGMAFDYFAREAVDIAVIEVGMGGRLDSTNVLTPELSIITNISLDHVQFLGNTLPAIAEEKAGIVKPRVPVLIGEYTPETRAVFERKALNTNSPIYFAEDLSPSLHEIEFSLKGPYQQKNLTTLLAAFDILKSQGYSLPTSALSEVQTLTGLRGRWETLGENPLILCDTGHNEAAIRYICRQLEQESYAQLHIVWGMVGDKDSTAALALLPKNAHYYWCAPQIPRAKPVEELAEEANQLGLSGKRFSSVKEALQAAKHQAKSDDLIFIGGSTFVVADALL